VCDSLVKAQVQANISSQQVARKNRTSSFSNPVTPTERSEGGAQDFLASVARQAKPGGTSRRAPARWGSTPT
jgi:hypothetical protein